LSFLQERQPGKARSVPAELMPRGATPKRHKGEACPTVRQASLDDAVAGRFFDLDGDARKDRAALMAWVRGNIFST
jgi:hypothetical protein